LNPRSKAVISQYPGRISLPRHQILEHLRTAGLTTCRKDVKMIFDPVVDCVVDLVQQQVLAVQKKEAKGVAVGEPRFKYHIQKLT